jgi:hypothetical protein
MNDKKIEISPEVVAESLRLARANQAPGQTKEQTQLIARGIQKGIAEFKREQKSKQRAADKARKKQLRQNHASSAQDANSDGEMEEQQIETPSTRNYSIWLPWILLILTWIGIATGYVIR